MTTGKDKETSKKSISNKSIEGIIKSKTVASNVIRLGNNENAISGSPKAAKAIVDYLSVQDINKNNLSLYTEHFNSPLSTSIKRHFKEIGSAEVAVGNGLSDVIINLIRAVLTSDKKAIIHTPIFPFYETTIHSIGSEITFVRSFAKDDFKINTEQILDSIDNDVKLIILCSPCNPTGASIKWEEIKSIVDKAALNDAFVFLDEAYIEYSTEQSHIDKVKDNPNLIVGRTFSKAYGLGGLRVGWAVMSRDILSLYRKVQCPFAVSVLSSIAAQASLNDAEFLNKVIQNNTDGKKFLLQELTKLGIVHFTSNANFISFFASDDFHRKASELCNWSLKHGLLIKNAAMLRDAPPELTRVTIGLPEQNQKFIDILKQKSKLIKLPEDFSTNT